MEYTKLDPRSKTSWRVGRGLRFILWVIVCGAVSLMVPYEETYGKIIEFAILLLLVYKLAGLVVYPMIEYKQWGYSISEDRVDIHHGIFFVKHTIVPIIRIQHITVSQGPINKQLGLYEVELSLASDSFEIPCLDKETADEIAENLKAKLYNRLEQREAAGEEE